VSEPMSCLQLSMRILAAICALIFIVTLPFGLLAFFSSNVIFSPEELSSTLSESLIASGVLRRSITEMLSEMEFGDDFEDDTEVRQALSDLSADEWDRIIDLLLPDAWMENQLKGAVMSIHTWLDDDRLTPGIEIDLRPIKARMQGESMLEVIDLIVDSWPTCTQEQVDRMRQASVEAGHPVILYCEPPEPFRSELIDFATRRFQSFFRDLPATFSAFDTEQNDLNLDDVLLLKERIRTIRAFTMGGWLLSAALLGLIMILAIRSWRDVAIWWGLPVLIAGILTIALGFSAGTAFNRYWQQASVEFRQQSSALYDLLLIPVTAVREKVTGEVMGAGVLITIMGIAILVIGYLFHRAVRPAVPTSSQNVVSPGSVTPPAYADSGGLETTPVPPPANDENGERPSGMFG
jgi:hypothetical protein